MLNIPKQDTTSDGQKTVKRIVLHDDANAGISRWLKTVILIELLLVQIS